MSNLTKLARRQIAPLLDNKDAIPNDFLPAVLSDEQIGALRNELNELMEMMLGGDVARIMKFADQCAGRAFVRAYAAALERFSMSTGPFIAGAISAKPTQALTSEDFGFRTTCLSTLAIELLEEEMRRANGRKLPARDVNTFLSRCGETHACLPSDEPQLLERVRTDATFRWMNHMDQLSNLLLGPDPTLNPFPHGDFAAAKAGVVPLVEIPADAKEWADKLLAIPTLAVGGTKYEKFNRALFFAAMGTIAILEALDGNTPIPVAEAQLACVVRMKRTLAELSGPAPDLRLPLPAPLLNGYFLEQAFLAADMVLPGFDIETSNEDAIRMAQACCAAFEAHVADIAALLPDTQARDHLHALNTMIFSLTEHWGDQVALARAPNDLLRTLGRHGAML